MQYQNIHAVSKRFDVTPSTIWRWVKDGVFPAPRKIGPSVARWHDDDVRQFEVRSATRS